jgi:hypothetical protein
METTVTFNPKALTVTLAFGLTLASVAQTREWAIAPLLVFFLHMFVGSSSAVSGDSPSGPARNEWSAVTVPSSAILNTEPRFAAPPSRVVP